MPIFDQGYQHWSGTLKGHAWRWLAITRHGVKIGKKSLFLRVFLYLAWAPALALAFMLCIWGLVERKSDLVGQVSDFLSFLAPKVLANPLDYRVTVWTLFYSVFMQVELYISIVLILLVGPNLISQDLRFNAMPLYFSRPLRRIDYFLGKLGIIAAFLGMVVIVPAIVAYILGLLFSHDITIIRDTLPILLASIAYGAVISLSAGMLVLALSSLSRNSRYTALFWLGTLLVGMTISWALNEIDKDQRRYAYVQENVRIQSQRMESDPATRHRAQLEQEKRSNEALDRETLAAQHNWRPLVSYTANLSRIGDRLLNTRATWIALSEFVPPDQRQAYLLEKLDPQYPWYWSAEVLAVLFGLSAWILNFRVRSLDRLK